MVIPVTIEVVVAMEKQYAVGVVLTGAVAVTIAVAVAEGHQLT